jgi:hypothetical protein
MRDELDTDARAQSSRSNHDTTLQTWVRYHRLWHGADAETFPITADALLHVAAIFKRRGYRSFANYLSRAKRAHIESGFGGSQVLDLAARDASRSVNRGLGPARQSAELDVVKVAALCVTSLSRLSPWGLSTLRINLCWILSSSCGRLNYRVP